MLYLAIFSWISEPIQASVTHVLVTWISLYLCHLDKFSLTFPCISMRSVNDSSFAFSSRVSLSLGFETGRLDFMR